MPANSAPSVPHLTGRHASGQFITQMDGSGDDDSKDHALSEKPTNLGPGEDHSPSKSRGKGQSSPIKRASSVASSAYRRLTSFGGGSKEKTEDVHRTKPKKEDDPAKMSPAEKAAHKNKWAKRMNDLKNEDHAWMSEYHGGKQHK